MSENSADNPVRLNGNAAIDQAAHQAEFTSGRNILDTHHIDGLEGIPHPEETANLRLGPNLHDGLLALLPLVGVWRGEGQAAVRTSGDEVTEYAFGEELVISHNGENYLSFHSRTWKLDAEGNYAGPDTNESGFWRISLDDEIEVVAARADGMTEIFYGEPLNERAWQLQSASTMVTATGPAHVGAGKRMYGLMPNGHLGWVDERDNVQRSAELTRVVG
ncbi:MAG: FABP family protein [Corynebacterium sp.]|nr:FABP family protein [Corynebacterium sp.]